MLYFLIAFLAGVVLQFLGTWVVACIIRDISTEKELFERKAFHLGIALYCIGFVCKYGGVTLALATLIKEWLP